MKSAKTIESYVGDTFGFLAYLAQMGTEFNGEFKRFYVTSYRAHLLENGYDFATVNKKINSLQAFNRYLAACGLMSEVVVDFGRDKVKVGAGSEAYQDH